MSENELMIRVQDVKKQYRLGQIGGGTLRGDLQSWWARKCGKEDPNTQIGTGVYETIIYSAVGDVGSIETAVSALGYMGSAMVTLGIAVAFGVFWFGLTVWLMRNKLNLE